MVMVSLFKNWIGRLLACFRLILIFGSMAFVVVLGVVLLKLKLADQKLAFRIRTAWCRFALRVLGVKVHRTGEIDLTEGSLYVGNHRSLVDPLVAFSYLNKGYAVSKAEVSSYPIVSTGAAMSGVIYVERQNSTSRKSTKQSILELLLQKKSILLFPEGTVSVYRHSLPFRKGSFEAAAEAKCPVVAFALEMGDPDSDFWYGAGLFDLYFQGFSKWRTDVYLHFFEPLRGDSGEQLCAEVEARINAKMREFQKNWKGEPKIVPAEPATGA